MSSARSKFHFSYIRDFDRFKATFDEKGWSKKTKKCEKTEEPGFPSYYVVHRYEYKGEDGHTKGRLLVSDLPPVEHEKREQRRKKKIERWRKEQQLIKHQENNDNGEKENNRIEKARNIESDNRKESVDVANMDRKQKDNGHTSEIELEERARNYVEEIINNSLILLQCDAKGNENHKLAELTTEATVHDLSAEQKQEEKTKNTNTEDHTESKKREVEHFKRETNEELREIAQNVVNEIIHNSIVSLQVKEAKVERPVSAANLSEAKIHVLSAEQQEKKTKNANIQDHLESKKREVEHFKCEANEELRETAQKFVNEMFHDSIVSLQVKEAQTEHPVSAVNLSEAKVHVLSAEQQEEKTKNANIQDHLESKKREVEHFRRETNQELREMAQNFVNEIIHNSIVSLQVKEAKTEHPVSVVNLSVARTPERKGKERNNDVFSPREYSTLEAGCDKGKLNATEIGQREMVRGYINDIIEKSLASLRCNEQEGKYAQSMVPGQTPERHVKEKKIRDILGTVENKVPESDQEGCNTKTHDKNIRDTARKLDDQVIDTSLAKLKCTEPEVKQPKSLLFLSECKLRENKYKAKTGDIHPRNRTKQETEHSQLETNIPEREHSDIARRLIDDIIRNGLGSLKCENKEREHEDKAKAGSIQDSLKYTKQEVVPPQSGNEVKETPIPQECNEFEAKSLLLLLVQKSSTNPTRLSSELLDMEGFRKETSQQYNEIITRDVPAVRVDAASVEDTTSSNDAAPWNDTASISLDVTDIEMEQHCSQETSVKERKESKMRRMLRRVRKGIRCLYCCLKQ